MMDHDLEECFKLVQDVARKAGEMVRAATAKEGDMVTETKESRADLVTETDKAVEDLIISSIKEKFPTHSFIGEESVAAGQKCDLTDNPTWIIDPIDGTTNFVHRFPYVAVSIALLVKRKTEIGLIYNPILDHMYTARPGKGAFCNGTKLSVTKTKDLGSALVCCEFGSSRDPVKLDSKFRTMRNVINKAHGVRLLGSAAFELALVAKGEFDAFYNAHGLQPWDIAAGKIIITEAGGVIMNPDGGPLDLMARRVLCAGTQELADQLSKCIEHIEFDRD